MVKSVGFNPHILEDKIVLDGISAINILKEERNLAGRIAGGMAVQSYIPKELHRGTIDVDYSLVWNGCITCYKDLCLPMTDFLQKLGYEISFKRKGLAHEITYKDFKNQFMIQHPNRSPKHFEKIKKDLEREVANQRRVNVLGIEFDALSPEDIFVTKLNRVLVFKDKYNLQIPSEKESIESLRKISEELGAEIVSKAPQISPQEVANLRMINDLYDMKCLTNHANLDKKYLQEALISWGDMNERLRDVVPGMEESIL